MGLSHSWWNMLPKLQYNLNTKTQDMIQKLKDCG